MDKVFGFLCLIIILWVNSSPVYIAEYNTASEAWKSKSNSQKGPCQIVTVQNVTRPHKVLLFIDSKFFEVFKNWNIYYQNVCGRQVRSQNNLLLICLDDQVSVQLKSLGLRCKQIEEENPSLSEYMGLSLIWMKRLEIISALLTNGTDILLSDSDAFWLKNPYAELNQHVSSSHIVASRGWFPFSISRIWGSTLCMGFMYIKADVFTINLFQEVLNRMRQKQLVLEAHRYYMRTKKTLFINTAINQTLAFDVKKWNKDKNRFPDDQNAINQALLDMNIKWPDNLKEFKVEDSHSGQLLWKDQLVNITLLPEQKFVRNCANNRMNHHNVQFRPPTKILYNYIQNRISQAIMAHCFLTTHATGSFDKKKNYLVYYSLWRLPYDAEEVAEFVHQDFRQYSNLYDFNETDIGYRPSKKGPRSAVASSHKVDMISRDRKKKNMKKSIRLEYEA